MLGAKELVNKIGRISATCVLLHEENDKNEPVDGENECDRVCGWEMRTSLAELKGGEYILITQS